MTKVKYSANLIPHPSAEGWVQGWAVLCSTRTEWNLVAVHADQVQAEQEAAQLGEPYKATWGSFRPETDDFIHGHGVESFALPLVV
jgi:hypothetical protein